MRERTLWVTHDTTESVDALLSGRSPTVEVRTRTADRIVVSAMTYAGSDAPTAVPSTERRDESGWAANLGAVQDKDKPGARGSPPSRRAPAGRSRATPRARARG
jgi:hypothetical protein